MRALDYNKHSHRIFLFFVAVFLLVNFFTMNLGYTNGNSRETDTHDRTKNQKTHITADKLISDSEADYAEFVGNVRAIQGETVITADTLKIFFKKNSGNKDNPSPIEESIKTIVANGNVKIKFDNRVAVTQQAVYSTETEVLVLSGDDSKIISGNDSISGEKITLYRTNGRINVESGKQKRVQAVFYSGEKGLK